MAAAMGGFAVSKAPLEVGLKTAVELCADALILQDAAAGTLGVLHLAHRFVFLALHAAFIGRFTIPMTACIEVFA